MPTMMPSMMSGMGYMFIWIVLITLVCLILIGAYIWLLASWLKKQMISTSQYIPQPQDGYEEYEQGYQSQQRQPETYQEGDQRYSYSQNEKGQTQYQEMELWEQ